jgi:predicted Rossmann fold nucleotide-binding protein DprA/Smf involved in DNA uptake
LESTLTPDTQTVLLLCGELGQRGENGPKPLGLRQYNSLASWLRGQGLRPGDLLTNLGQTRLEDLRTPELNPGRVAPLLERGAALALVVERWERSGLWVISRSDPQYPERLKRYLGHGAPPLLYGVGTIDLLGKGGLAVVGSRDRSEDDGEYARRVGELCARQGIAIVSGAAKGIDRDAMSGSIEAGGWALGVLAEGLAKTATSGQYRAGLVSDHLTLVSAYDPDSRWFAHLAMERNKLIYGLCDAALVVSSAAETGGTWAGAVEALNHRKVKVFVKLTGVVAPGNPKLESMGGIAFPPEPWDDIRSLFTPPIEKAPPLFGTPLPEPFAPNGHADAKKSATATPTEKEQSVVPPDPPREVDSGSVPAKMHSDEPMSDAYRLVIESIVLLLNEARTDEWMAEKMNVRAVQMKEWLEKAVVEGRAKKLKKPVRYLANTQNLFRDRVL